MHLLENMNEHQIERLFSKYSIQLGLEYSFINFWKSQFGSHLTKQELNLDQPSVVIQGQKRQNSEDVECEVINIENVLNSSSHGRSILELYKKNSDLNDGMRTVIVELIINHMLQYDLAMNTPIAKKISENICSLFPSELMAS